MHQEQESTLLPTSSLSLLHSPIVNCFPTAPTSMICRWRAIPSLHRPADCSRTRTSCEVPLLRTIPGALDCWRASILCYSGTPFAHSPDTICATDPAATSPVERNRAREPPRTVHGYRSRRVTAAAARFRMPHAGSSSSSSAPPPQKKQPRADADRDRSSCRPPPELPAPGRISARSLQVVEAYLFIRRACRVRPRVRFLCCRACVACWNRRIDLLPANVLCHGGACLVGRAGKDGGRECACGEAATSGSRDGPALDGRTRAELFLRTRENFLCRAPLVHQHFPGFPKWELPGRSHSRAKHQQNKSS